MSLGRTDAELSGMDRVADRRVPLFSQSHSHSHVDPQAQRDVEVVLSHMDSRAGWNTNLDPRPSGGSNGSADSGFNAVMLGHHLIPFLLRDLQRKQEVERERERLASGARRRLDGPPSAKEDEKEKQQEGVVNSLESERAREGMVSPFHILRCLAATSPLFRLLLETAMPQGLSLFPDGPTVRRSRVEEDDSDEVSMTRDRSACPEALATEEGRALVREELNACGGQRAEAEATLKALYAARVGRRPRMAYATKRERAAPHVIHVTAAVAPAPELPASSSASNQVGTSLVSGTTTPAPPLLALALQRMGWWVRCHERDWRLCLTLYAPMIRLTDIDGLTVRERRNQARLAQYEAEKNKNHQGGSGVPSTQSTPPKNVKKAGAGGSDPRKTVVMLDHLAALVGGPGEREDQEFPFHAVEALRLQGLCFSPDAWMHLPILFQRDAREGDGGVRASPGRVGRLGRLDLEGCTVQGFSETVRRGPRAIVASPLTTRNRTVGGGGGTNAVSVGAYWSELEVLSAVDCGTEGLWLGLEQLLAPLPTADVCDDQSRKETEGNGEEEELTALRVLQLSRCSMGAKRFESVLRRIAVRNRGESLYEVQLDFENSLGHTLIETLTACPTLAAALYRLDIPHSGVTDAEKLVQWVISMQTHDEALNPPTAGTRESGESLRMPRRVFNYMNLRWNSGIDDRFYLACEAAGIRVGEIWIAGTGGTRATADRVGYYISP